MSRYSYVLCCQVRQPSMPIYSRFHGNQAQENVPPKAGEYPCTELVRKPLYILEEIGEIAKLKAL